MPVNTTLEKYKNAALFLRYTLIRHENGLFKDALQTEEIRKRRLCVLVWTNVVACERLQARTEK